MADMKELSKIIFTGECKEFLNRGDFDSIYNYLIGNGYLEVDEANELTKALEAKGVTVQKMSSLLQTIPAYAFYNDKTVDKYNLGKVTRVGDYAFSKSSVKTIVLPSRGLVTDVDTAGKSDVYKRGYGAYSNDSKLFGMKAEMAVIGMGAFEGSDLEKIMIPNNSYPCLYSQRAFYGCANMKQVLLHKDTILAPNCFANCTSLNNIGIHPSFDINIQTKNDKPLPTVFSNTAEGCVISLEGEWLVRNQKNLDRFVALFDSTSHITLVNILRGNSEKDGWIADELVRKLRIRIYNDANSKNIARKFI